MMFRDEEYILIQGWMINRLKLKGNDLLVYAIIYGYSQDGVHRYYGSMQYLADWTNSTISGIQKNLNSLLANNFIFKNKDKGVVEYWVNLDKLQLSCNDNEKEIQLSSEPIQLSSEQVQLSCQDIQLSCSNNINNINNNILKKELFQEKSIPKQESIVLDKNTFYKNNKKSRSFKKLKTWITLYVDDLEIKEQLENWLTVTYNNGKITTLECLKNKVDFLNENNLTKEEKILAIKDAADKCWFTFQYSVEKIIKNRYNIQNNNVVISTLEKNNDNLELSNEVF